MRLHIKILVQFFINGYSYFKVNIMHKAR